MFTFGSVCSGIEAASAAWEPLGARALWLAEIEAFPSAVLAHRFPATPNLGDMTTIAALIRSGAVPAPGVLVGGTPCQAFSIAGLRGGLSDPRGALTLAYVDLLNAIDTARALRGEPSAIGVWENVPGVLSSRDNAFGCFLAGLAGESSELEPPGRKWADAGCVFGPQRTIAWRTLDAQYFGVAQRRRRVFVVASARKGFDPCAVLFESEGVRRDIAPSRGAEQSVAGTLEASAGRSRGAGTPHSLLQPVAPTLDANMDSKWGSNQWVDNGFAVLAPAAGTLRGSDGGADVDHARAGHLVGCWWNGDQVSQTLDAVLAKGQAMPEKNRFPAVLQPACFVQNSRSEVRLVDGDGQITGAIAAGPGVQQQHYIAQPLAFHGTQDPCVSEHVSNTIGRNHGQEACFMSPAMRVRRIMPREGERLQGFPDDWTRVPYRGKSAPDGPRYKAIGNSMAVPCMAWIGDRIIQQLGVLA